jgi:hypothetical protein
MKKKKKSIKLLFWSMGALFISVIFVAGKAAASPSRELPPEDDPIWDVFANLPRPDDSHCVDYITSQGASLAQATESCQQLAQMPDEIYNDMAADGMFDAGRLTTDLRTMADWRRVENLTFDHGDGMIQFTEPINFMSREFMLFMDNFAQRMEAQPGLISLDADIVDGLKNRGAILTMRNVPDFDNPVILVDGKVDSEGVVSGIVYNKENHTLTFTAAHFTSFEAAEASAVLAPKITKVKYRRYLSKSGKVKVRVSVYGKRFKKKSRVYFGSKKARKTSYKNNHKLIAKFSWKELRKLGHKKLKIKVKNPNGVVGTAKNRKTLGKIKFL